MSKALATYSAPPIGSLAAYIGWINQAPILTQQEEQALATRFRDSNDLEAARQLVLSHLRFVASIARNYLGYGLSHADIIQEGNVGLMKAVKRFDPCKGVRLTSFATHWIKAEIHEFILRNWRIVKVATTKAQRKLFFNLRKITSHQINRFWLTNKEAETVAKTLNVKTRDVRTMETRMLRHYDKSIESDGDDGSSRTGSAGFSSFSPSDYWGNQHTINPASQWEKLDQNQYLSERLKRAIASLSPRDQDIIRQRWLAEKKTTLQALAKKYKISAERIRQREQQAILALKNRLVE